MSTPREPAAAAAPPRSFAALRHPGFRRYFVTTALAMMADNIEHVISYWVMFEKFHSPALAGFAVLSHWLPFLLFSVYFGALADRYDCRRIIQLAQLLFMGVSLAWAVLFYTDTLEMWHAAVLLVVHGMAGVLWGPAAPGADTRHRRARAHRERGAAVRHEPPARDTARPGGRRRTDAGAGAGRGPARERALLRAAGLVAAQGSVWRASSGARKTPPRRGGGIADAWATMREVSGNRTILSMILLAGTSSLLVGNAFQAQMPEFAHDLGTEKADSSYAMLLAANAAGALAAGITLEAQELLQARPQHRDRAGDTVVHQHRRLRGRDELPARRHAHVRRRLPQPRFVAMAQALIQLEAPPHLRGRLIGLYYLSNNGLRAFSGVTVGILGSLIGIHWSLALSALDPARGHVVLLAFSMRAR